jgi:putative oxidoreductase
MTSSISKFNHRLAAVGDHLRNPLLLAIRLYWGWQFFIAGKGKLSDLSRPTDFFASLHIPAPHLNAIIVSVTECFGGLLFLLGLGSRFLAALFIFEMIVAYVTSEQEALHAIFSDSDKFVSAAPFLFLFASVIVFAFGPGRYSIDALLSRKSASAPRSRS